MNRNEELGQREIPFQNFICKRLKWFGKSQICNTLKMLWVSFLFSFHIEMQPSGSSNSEARSLIWQIWTQRAKIDNIYHSSDLECSPIAHTIRFGSQHVVLLRGGGAFRKWELLRRKLGCDWNSWWAEWVAFIFLFLFWLSRCHEVYKSIPHNVEGLRGLRATGFEMSRLPLLKLSQNKYFLLLNWMCQTIYHSYWKQNNIILKKNGLSQYFLV